MKVLILGGGGREHAIALCFSKSPKVNEIFCAPGNGGTTDIATNVDLNPLDIEAVKKWVIDHSIDLTVVGPEAPLALGIVDAFEKEGLKVFGANQRAAQLESSKAFSKEFLKKYKIPTASGETFRLFGKAIKHLERKTFPVVIKADGLAQGKGVVICATLEQAQATLKSMMVDKKFGEASSQVVIEEFLEGEEVSYMGFCDGETFLAFPSAQDHKKALDGDKGLNTGGMGAYSPVPWFDEAWDKKVRKLVVEPVLKGMKAEGIVFRGFLYIGFLISQNTPYVLEFNVRMGDPEAQVLLCQLESDLSTLMDATLSQELRNTKLRCMNKPTLAVVMASEGYPEAYQMGFEIEGLEKVKDVQVFHSGTQIKSGKVVTSGGRVLCVTATDESFKAVIKKVYDSVRQIHWGSEYYRKDIGFRLCQKK